MVARVLIGVSCATPYKGKKRCPDEEGKKVEEKKQQKHVQRQKELEHLRQMRKKLRQENKQAESRAVEQLMQVGVESTKMGVLELQMIN